MKHIRENRKSIINNWFNKHSDCLFRYALSRTKDKERAKDILQETFCSALQSFDKLKNNDRDDANTRRWLFGILKHKVVDCFRRAYKEIPCTMDYTTDIAESLNGTNSSWRSINYSPNQDPQKKADFRVLQKLVNNKLAQMPEKLSQVFNLSEINELDTETICKRLSISKSNLWVRLHRARKSLQRLLRKEHWLANCLVNEN